MTDRTESGFAAVAAERERGVVGLLSQRMEAERDRLFLWLPVAFGAGIAVYFGLPVEPSLAAVSFAVLSAVFVALRLQSGGGSRIAVVALLAALLGVLGGGVRTWHVSAPVIPAETGVRDVRGIVETFTREADGSARLILVPEAIEDLEADELPARLSLRVRIRDAHAAPGDRIAFPAVLMPPPDASEPGGFDYARQAFFQRIGAVGYPVADFELLEPAEAGMGQRVRAAVERLRGTIAARLETALEGEAGGIAAALIVGYRGGIPEDAEAALRTAGLAHILAISGLHMMLVVGALFWTTRALLALSQRLALQYPIKKWAAATALAGGLFYLVLSGGAIATQRAFVMAAIMLVAILLDRPAITLRNVAIAALIVLALAPEALVSVSFQMSFAATVALVAGYEAMRDRPRRVRRDEYGMSAHLRRYLFGLVMTALIAGIATAPYAAFHFQRVAVYGLAGNVLAMPFVGTLVMPAGLLGMCLMPFGLEWLPLQVMGAGIHAVLAVARLVASWPKADAVVPAFPMATLLLVTLGGLWLALWRTGWRLWGLGLMFAGVAAGMLAPRPDLYVSRNGGMAALAYEAGNLVFLPRTTSRYVAERWLRAAGDGRSPGDPSLREGASCDDDACIASVPGLSVALIRHPAAFAEECSASDIVVTDLAVPQWCREHALVLGPGHFAAHGATTVRRNGKTLIVETAGEAAGKRPWNVRQAAPSASAEE